MKTNMVSWFEIPVLNMERAQKFYETVFRVNISIHQMGDVLMGWFPPAEDNNAPGISGSLVLNEMYAPSEKNGVVIYFASQSGDLANELSRIEEAGGTILQDKTLIAEEVGYMALFLDSEGNRIALYNK
ncbi:glyoxalase [Tenacibaculum holothuriorum]|uniref:Glyoxalase n=1 Tax=Tenacibaculum holothuriorum TaxID=1635173 RepID=A0A1Y2PEV9_9FLAO|nr:glyoxalase [Tenacibaculum holothuriorum]OSY88327.1 glyoxalase [Tenacibaculum holothuriorum]